MGHELGTRALWWHELADADRAALDPGLPVDLDRRPDLLVIGGGIVGLTVAVYCRRLGIDRILVIDGRRLTAGATGGTGGALAPELHQTSDPPWFVAHARRSLALYASLDDAWRGALGLHWGPRLVLSLDPEPTSTDRWDDRVEHLTSEQVTEFFPQLTYDSAGVLASNQGQAQPLRLAAALARHAGTIATGVTAVGFESAGGRTVRVHTSVGTLHPGAVVVATGSIAGPSAPVVQRRVKGHLLATGPLPFPLPCGIHADGLGFGPLPGGRMLAGGTRDDSDTPHVEPAVVGRIRAHVRRIVPDLGDVAVTHTWCCFRPTTADGMPVIDRLRGADNAWMSIGHGGTGILMAPVLGQALASWITGGRRPAVLDPYALTMAQRISRATPMIRRSRGSSPSCC